MKDLQGFVKKHRFEVFLVAMFVLAGIFGMGLIWTAKWSVIFAALGGVLGAILPQQIQKLSHSVLGFFFRQDSNTQLILAGVMLILSILLCPLIFLITGLLGAKAMHGKMEEHSKDRP